MKCAGCAGCAGCAQCKVHGTVQYMLYGRIVDLDQAKFIETNFKFHPLKIESNEIRIKYQTHEQLDLFFPQQLVGTIAKGSFVQQHIFH